MRAVVVEAFGAPVQVRDVPEPACPPDGALVAVEATGLCRSDWHGWAGHDREIVLPHVPGHEFAGVIARVGSQVRGWTVGTRVTASFINACGTCAQCRAGDQQVCGRQTQPGFSRWGSFAELVAVQAAEVNLVALPEQVDAAAAATLGCRFATAYRAVVDVGRVRSGEWVAVHGCGGLGLSAVMIAAAAGARVVAVDVRAASLALARANGAEVVLEVSDGSADGGAAAAAGVRELTGGGAQLSLDALGSPGTCAASIGSLRPRGRHVQVGLLPEVLGRPEVPMHLVVAGELEVLGSHGMPARSYPAMLGLVAAGRLRPAALVSRRTGLAGLAASLETMGGAGPVGVVVADPRT